MSKLAAVAWTVLLACGGSGGKAAGPALAAPDGGSAGTTNPTPTPTPTANPTPTTVAPTPSNPTATSPPDPCAGLTPAAPLAAAIEHVEPFNSFPWYAAGTSDGDGAYVATLVGYKFHDYAFYAAAAPDQLVGSLQVGPRLTGTGPALAPQPHGFHSLRIASSMPAQHLAVSDGKGQVIADVLVTRGAAFTIAADPGGGSAVLTEDFPAGPGQWLERFDADGRSRGMVSLDAAGGLLGIAIGGEALVVGATQARWYDRDAKPLTDPFASKVGEMLVPLADGSVAARDQNRSWTGIYRPGATQVEEAPAWLAGQVDHDAWVVRGGRAMAFAPMGASQPGCSTGCGKLEILTPDGQSCGTVELPGGSDEPVNVGKDGTVFALTYGDDGTVHWRWWPKLLQ